MSGETSTFRTKEGKFRGRRNRLVLSGSECCPQTSDLPTIKELANLISSQVTTATALFILQVSATLPTAGQKPLVTTNGSSPASRHEGPGIPGSASILFRRNIQPVDSLLGIPTGSRHGIWPSCRLRFFNRQPIR
jgi:hypothetical protein